MKGQGQEKKKRKGKNVLKDFKRERRRENILYLREKHQRAKAKYHKTMRKLV